jgi:hypothetical protein
VLAATGARCGVRGGAEAGGDRTRYGWSCLPEENGRWKMLGKCFRNAPDRRVRVRWTQRMDLVMCMSNGLGWTGAEEWRRCSWTQPRSRESPSIWLGQLGGGRDLSSENAEEGPWPHYSPFLFWGKVEAGTFSCCHAPWPQSPQALLPCWGVVHTAGDCT